MKRFFAAVRGFFAYLFSPAGQAKVETALGQAESLVQAVMPVVEAVAAATPNRTDDEIVALVKRYAVPVTIPATPMTDADKGALLLQTAVTAAEVGVSACTGVPVSVITLAVQTAYTAMHAAAK
ncbi:MAG TPA: hypothetical protein VFB00_03985 [Terriglobales bacterium]|nr:hypothetical protein [Terriglobales bacterium]